MPRLKKETVEKDKQRIIDYLNQTDEYKTTFNISSFLRRHHSYTNSLLMQLKDDEKVSLMPINNICAWGIKVPQIQENEIKVES